ncbi:MAG: glycosyl hydrolase family 25 [Prevotella sp.]|nr:glycosyl hydrolase family 25 [Prevotella sp.]
MDGKPVIFFSQLAADSTLADVALRSDSAQTFTHKDTALWVDRFPIIPSCRGCLLTRNNIDSIKQTDIPVIVERERVKLDSLLRLIQEEESELKYYLRVHGVQDEGYNMIADYTAEHEKRKDRLTKAAQLLSNSGSVSIRLISTYRVLYNDENGKRQQDACFVRQQSGNEVLMQTTDRKTPNGVHSIFKRAAEVKKTAGRPIQDTILQPQPPTEGHAVWRDTDGSYYEGHWQDGKRDGFGFSLKNGTLRVGEWKADVFKGERLLYTNERIYGIDIARYQHGKGKKKYPIDWKNLRISHLGTLSKKQVSGMVDYPVSFIFIKATEGKDIKNAHYANDYVAARKHGFHVGSYHFFSIKSSATQQAYHFLKTTRFNKGDLPPVLDVEPSNAQINKMGGAEALFKAVRTWLKIVKERTGVSPILYVNQQFVNKYLPLAPDVKRDYDVWIARYGEYKPDVRLSIWQLSPDGRVKGIKSEVDIDVFNGYQDEWQEFLRNKTVR